MYSICHLTPAVDGPGRPPDRAAGGRAAGGRGGRHGGRRVHVPRGGGPLRGAVHAGTRALPLQPQPPPRLHLLSLQVGTEVVGFQNFKYLMLAKTSI